MDKLAKDALYFSRRNQRPDGAVCTGTAEELAQVRRANPQYSSC